MAPLHEVIINKKTNINDHEKKANISSIIYLFYYFKFL